MALGKMALGKMAGWVKWRRVKWHWVKWNWVNCHVTFNYIPLNSCITSRVYNQVNSENITNFTVVNINL